MRLNNWYLLTLRSGQGGSQLFIENLAHTRIADDDSGSFFPFGFNQLTCSFIYVGIDSD